MPDVPRLAALPLRRHPAGPARPAPTPADEERFAAAFGAPLPVAWRALLRHPHGNGGVPAGRAAFVPAHAAAAWADPGTRDEAAVAPVGRFCHVDARAAAEAGSVFRETAALYRRWPSAPPGLVACADDGDGNSYAVDLARGAVVIRYRDDEDGEEVPVAPSLAAFLDGIVVVDAPPAPEGRAPRR